MEAQLKREYETTTGADYRDSLTGFLNHGFFQVYLDQELKRYERYGDHFALVLINVDTGHAYIDPSTGSYLLQILLAGLLGAAFAVKIYWRRVRAFFARVFTGKTNTGNTPE